MFSLKQAAILALAGTALAAPLARRDGQQAGRMSTNYGFEIDGNDVIPVNGQPAGSEFVGYTVITIYPNQAAPTATATYQAPAGTPAATYAATTTTAAASSGSSSSGGGTENYMAIVNEWRQKGGLKALIQDSTLEGNAQKTVNDDAGTMSHELNPGSFAQVLAPGQKTDFEHCYVGGWLCEMPSLPGLNGVCATQGQGWSHNGETGHAEILTDPKYSKIGCAWSDGIWGCDLA